jgi:hypothetical protein
LLFTLAHVTLAIAPPARRRALFRALARLSLP